MLHACTELEFLLKLTGAIVGVFHSTGQLAMFSPLNMPYIVNLFTISSRGEALTDHMRPPHLRLPATNLKKKLASRPLLFVLWFNRPNQLPLAPSCG